MPIAVAVLACLFVARTAGATSIEPPLADTAKEHLAQDIFHEVRCAVCEGQSIADSDAVLAAQMRAHVRKLITAGKSEAEILDEFRERYGDKIIMTPPVAQRTWLLWAAPVLLVAGGAFLIRNATKGASA